MGTLFGDLAQLLVAQVLHAFPEVQDGFPHGLKGSVQVCGHDGQVPRLQRAAHGLAGLTGNKHVALTALIDSRL